MINVWFGCRELTSPCTRFIYRHERTRRRHRAKKLKMDFPGTEFSSHAKMGVCMLHQCLYTKDTHINDNHTADRTQKTSRQRSISQVLPNIFRHIQHYSLHPRNISFIVIPIVYWRRQDLLLTCQFFFFFYALSLPPLSLAFTLFLSRARLLGSRPPCLGAWTFLTPRFSNSIANFIRHYTILYVGDSLISFSSHCVFRPHTVSCYWLHLLRLFESITNLSTDKRASYVHILSYGTPANSPKTSDESPEKLDSQEDRNMEDERLCVLFAHLSSHWPLSIVIQCSIYWFIAFEFWHYERGRVFWWPDFLIGIWIGLNKLLLQLHTMNYLKCFWWGGCFYRWKEWIS